MVRSFIFCSKFPLDGGDSVLKISMDLIEILIN